MLSPSKPDKLASLRLRAKAPIEELITDEPDSEANQQLKNLKDMFDKLDDDGNGRLTKDEIRMGFEHLSPDEMPFAMEDILELVDILDTNNLGGILYMQLVKARNRDDID